jgi:hypothetical protein
MLNESKNLITRPQVARMFGVVCITVRRWEKIYGLTVHKITSRLTAYPADEIERIKSTSRVAAAPGRVQPVQFKPTSKSPRKISRRKFAMGIGALRAEMRLPAPPANQEAVQIGHACLPPGDRE